MTEIQWDRDEVTSIVVGEFQRFGAFVEGLSGEDLDVTTRCDGWTVRGVIGHLTGTVVDILAGTIGHRPPDVQAEAYGSWTVPQFTAALEAATESLEVHLRSLPDAVWNGPVQGVTGQVFATGVLTLAHELCVHTDDIDAALGRSSVEDRLWEISVRWLATEFTRLEYEPVTVELRGLPRFDINGGGPVVATDPANFVRVATGRMESSAAGIDLDLNIYGRDRRHIGV